MVDVVRRRGLGGRGRAAERHQPLGAVAVQYASMGWPVCAGAHPYRATRGSMEPGRACTCDRVGCPAPGAHPVSPTWQMQATVDENVIASWWEARPEAALGQDRMMFFVVTRGSPTDEDEWWSCGLDCEPESVVAGLRWHCRDSFVLAPPSSYADGLSARWLRSPAEHPLPDALRLLEYIVDACEA
jgi:hypothetical protein